MNNIKVQRWLCKTVDEGLLNDGVRGREEAEGLCRFYKDKASLCMLCMLCVGKHLKLNASLQTIGSFYENLNENK